jgi:hypothetical protein
MTRDRFDLGLEQVLQRVAALLQKTSLHHQSVAQKNEFEATGDRRNIPESGIALTHLWNVSSTVVVGAHDEVWIDGETLCAGFQNCSPFCFLS